MATVHQPPDRSASWSKEAFAMAAQAKILSGAKLEQLVVRLQRHSGRSRETCWRFIIQHGIKGRVDHRRWTEEELDLVREELVKRPITEIAKKLNRTPDAIRSALKRQHLSIRKIRCDLFSIESLSAALHIGKREILFWINEKWLPAAMGGTPQRPTYTITPEALLYLYKHHHHDLLKRGIANQSLFEAYVQYCYSPKHTVGEQLLNVRRDKRERAAFSDLSKKESIGEGKDEDPGDESRYAVRF